MDPKLYPYQRDWIEDDSRFKIACKARQIGFTYAAAWRVVDVRLQREGLTLWVSASERQALEAMEHIRRFARQIEVAAIYEESFVDATSVRQHSIRFKNGSRIIALPSNPDTVRGFSGDIVLDEFAFHRDADEIWRAAFAIATRGHQLEIISTPNGARGRYYEIAKAAGLVDFVPTMLSPGGGGHRAGQGSVDRSLGHRARRKNESTSPFSAHWIDLALARQLGFVVDAESLRVAIADDDAWQQEYCCRFLAHAAHFLPPELVVAAESPDATTGPPSSPAGHLFLGVDIGRHRDLTVLWFLECENPRAPERERSYITRGIVTLEKQPFTTQRATLDSYLAMRASQSTSQPVNQLTIARCALDSTGMGAMLAEELGERWGSRVEPVVFTNSVKERMAVRVKRLLEDRRLKIPYDPKIRAAFNSIKRVVTAAGNVRFDADRSEEAGHADAFWALALTLEAAADDGPSTEFISTEERRAFARSSGY